MRDGELRITLLQVGRRRPVMIGRRDARELIEGLRWALDQ